MTITAKKLVVSKMGITIIYEFCFQKCTCFSVYLCKILNEFKILFERICVGAEESPVNSCIDLCDPVDTEVSRKFFSRILISRERFINIYREGLESGTKS